MANASAVTAAKNVGNGDHSGAFEELEEHQVVGFSDGGRAKASKQMLREALKAWVTPATSGSPPGVADGDAVRSPRVIGEWRGMASRVNRKSLGLCHLALPISLLEVVRAGRVARVVAHYFPRKHAAHAHFIQEAATRMKQFVGGDPPAATQDPSPFTNLIFQVKMMKRA
jgi:hypothetical protein